ncbi:MAG: acetylxylan esterase [Clostridia bacterium]|nr:acetylxylan esterase [Clostridia bacterium]
MRKDIDGDVCHEILLKNAERKLGFLDGCDFAEWQTQVREKLFALLGMEKIEKNACPLRVDIEEKDSKDGYTQYRFTFESEVGAIVPCYLLIPDTGKEKYPVAITLQGHSTGFHNSVGILKYPIDQENVGHWDFALQAVQNGFAALAIEQRGMGERHSKQYPNPTVQACAVTALHALTLGRTLLGERVWDVRKGIDALEALGLPELDLDKILITGESGGGTASFYAACYDPRIRYVAPGYAFCSFKDSIWAIHHCCCNYIPGIAEWFEMEDLACLIAPRPMTVIAGKLDTIFPLEGVKSAYATVQKIYDKAKAADKCRLLITERDHYWCQAPIWQTIKEETAKLGW